MERYASGVIPWDDDLPPPELMALVEKQPAGRALDLGCGYGRSSIYLAQHEWEVDGLDFVPQAVCRRQSEEQQKQGCKNWSTSTPPMYLIFLSFLDLMTWL